VAAKHGLASANHFNLKPADDFVRELFKRYEYWRSQPLIDPAE